MFSTFLASLKLKIDGLLSVAVNIVTNNDEFMETLNEKLRLKDCISRAGTAYFALTKFSAPRIITPHQLQTAISCSSTIEELTQNLKEYCSAKDETYILLLTIAVANSYRKKSPPEISGG